MQQWTDDKILKSMVDLYLPPEYENRVLALVQRVRDEMAADKQGIVHSYRALVNDYDLLLGWAQRVRISFNAVLSEGNIPPQVLEAVPHE